MKSLAPHRPPNTFRPDAIVLAKRHGVPVLDVVMPVRNEAKALEQSVRRLHGYMREHLPYQTRITIADEASEDDTPRVTQALAEELDGLRVLRFEQKGRGGALNAAWSSSSAPVLASMGVGLSIDLAALAPLTAPLISGHSDVALGFRARHGALGGVSRAEAMLLAVVLRAKFPKARCGLTAIRAEAARELLPHVADADHFFDTELLILAERVGLRLHEVPVDCAADGDRPDAAPPVGDLRGCARLVWERLVGAVPVRHLADRLGSTPARGFLLRQLVRLASSGRQVSEAADARTRLA